MPRRPSPARLVRPLATAGAVALLTTGLTAGLTVLASAQTTATARPAAALSASVNAAVGPGSAASRATAGSTATRAKKYISCTYVVGKPGSTDCSKTTFTADYSFNFNVCWRLRPSAKTYLERRVVVGWVRDKRDVSVSQASPCRGEYPWRTSTRIAVKAGQTKTQEFRFVLPKTWQYARVDYAFGVCVLPAGSSGPCPPFATPTPTPTVTPTPTPTPTETATPVPSITVPSDLVSPRPSISESTLG